MTAEWDRSKILGAAAALERALDAFGDTGALEGLQARGKVTAQQVGNWDAGQALAQTVGLSHQHISSVSVELLSGYRAVIEALRRSASNYGVAEDDTQRKVGRVREQLHDPQKSDAPFGN
ncbi:hypothetical protein [Actinomadura rupiterrae]|uniref:hypothetical protein n=1 Tax=Actinomadura rupiterrae TaxID=559627 RepID=UPI0020A37E42|nr:hypothetical protein [Actinomadura rupiterrae]MCP2341989.1 hypothetical protein [Actinomadura rupiterrae]